MNTLENLLYEMESIKSNLDTDPETLDKCIKLTESIKAKYEWELDRAYDQGWVDCLNLKK
jgi:hypothetical protein